jgi:hypothetical protein
MAETARVVVALAMSALSARAWAETPPARPAFRAAGETCSDERLDGLESDVDCGGDCWPCPVDARCQVARDCESGRCAEGRCAEQIYQPGSPIPEGYHLERAENDAAATARLCGTLFLGVGYAGAYASVVSYPTRLGALYLPVLGPWVALGHIDSTVGKTLLATDGALQAAGAILLVGGLVVAKQQLLRDPEESLQIAIAPSPSGLRIFGSF